MPMLVQRLILESPTTCLMFIPHRTFRRAIEIIEGVWDRHLRRKAYFGKRIDDSEKALNDDLLGSSYKVVTTLQRTLMEELNCCIAVICPWK
jgi:hypothetical protein